ncbi:hypothetical protein V8E55_001049 [Tylopilus felleus]
MDELATTESEFTATWFKQEQWRRNVISTLCLWAAAQPDVWAILKEKIIGVLKLVLPVAFPLLVQLPGQLMVHHKVVMVVRLFAYQQLCDWRHSVGSAVLILCASFFIGTEQPKMIEETQHFLKNHAYLYENLQSDDCSKAFRSIFMMTLLAEAYVPSVKGFLDIPSLNTLAIHESGISGIFGLCGAAIEVDKKGKIKVKLPVTLNKTSGKVSSTPFQFSEQNWGDITRKLACGAEHRAVNEQKSIMDKAQALAHRLNLF